MSGSKFDGMTPEEIRAYFDAKEAEARQEWAGKPLPEFSRVKRDDHPHWEVVAYEFHTEPGKRVLVVRGGEPQVEGTLGGVRAARGQDELLVELGGSVWACVRADGENWGPGPNGRVRVETLTVPVLARPLAGRGTAQEQWTLQTNMEGQP